jgi:hypothetical protein
MERDDWENHWEYDPLPHPQDVLEGLPEEWGYSDNRTPGSGNPNAQTASNMLEMPVSEADETQSEFAPPNNTDRENQFHDTSANNMVLNPSIVTKEQVEPLVSIMPEKQNIIGTDAGSVSKEPPLNVLSSSTLNLGNPQVLNKIDGNDHLPTEVSDDRSNLLPPLVRLDGQPLKPAENMYPAMAYRENEHQSWPEEAIKLAAKRYPDLPKQVAASRELVPDSPDDLQDPDYYPMPDNPTFKDQFYHGVWREKKQGKL